MKMGLFGKRCPVCGEKFKGSKCNKCGAFITENGVEHASVDIQNEKIESVEQKTPTVAVDPNDKFEVMVQKLFQTLGEFNMMVEDVFKFPNNEIVVTGQIVAGELSVGDTVKIGHKTTKILQIEMLRKFVQKVKKRDICGLRFSGISKDEIVPYQTTIKFVK